MQTSDYVMRVLRAEEGKFLTNTDAKNISQKVITTEVYLAANDDPDRWAEISEEEAEAIRNEQELELQTHEKPVPANESNIDYEAGGD